MRKKKQLKPNKNREDTLALLKGDPDMTYREIVEKTNMKSTSVALHHVRALRDAGLIEERMPWRLQQAINTKKDVIGVVKTILKDLQQVIDEYE